MPSLPIPTFFVISGYKGLPRNNPRGGWGGERSWV